MRVTVHSVPRGDGRKIALRSEHACGQQCSQPGLISMPQGGTLDVELTSLESAPSRVEVTPAPPERSRQWRKDPIGTSLEDIRSRLLGIAAALRRHSDEHTVPLLQESQRQLEQASCRIAVIGQVKAGKSTFINAMVEHPGLLPSDINPATAVVTSLHFRKTGALPEHAAVFRLFSSEEWSDLAEGGGSLRKLTERLVPGFKPELLRVQLEFLRKRAERRLGPHFHELLGQCHRFKELTPDLLAHYISAVDDYEETDSSNRQWFSDITRTADLFFSDGPFSFPTTLIDTPGNNDPFLVRDEITRRSLDNADILVFVLSALQPLSTADISMLRLLNGLHKDRIIVFINRVDQLVDPVADGATIKAAVEQRLRRNYRHSTFRSSSAAPYGGTSACWRIRSIRAPTSSRRMPRHYSVPSRPGARAATGWRTSTSRI